MYCKHCGVHLEATAAFCHACGKPTGMPEAPEYLNPECAATGAVQYPEAGGEKLPPPGLKRKEYYRKHFRCRKSLKAAGILCYIAAALVAAGGLLADAGLWVLIDVFILLVFGGLMHLARSRFCAIVMCVYAVFCVAMMFLIGTGWLTAGMVVVAAILGVRGTFCFARDWKHYCKVCGEVH